MGRRNLHLLRCKALEYIEESRVVERTIEETRVKAFQNGSTKSEQVNSLSAQKEVIDDRTREILTPYAQVTCQHFSKKMLNMLPRELRDVVYEYLLTPDYVWVGTEYLTNSGPPCENDRDVHFWDLESLFYLWNRAKNNEIIERFLTSDRWGLGLKPHEHISKVRFDLGDSIIHHPGSRVHYLGRRRSEHCLPPNYAATLTAPLKTFLNFEFPDRAHFLIRTHTLGGLQEGCLASDILRETLGTLIADFSTLRTRGQRWLVQWCELPHLEFTSRERDLSTEFCTAAIKKELSLQRTAG
ncbi:hypothetical protein EK21DRAFT_115687 [Setomelanomma holmii]|uniref:Uncharacterized protein n=1 Tax=Setomelanomma holmii TaxID=210430 RepID=A0A9P4LIG7_9PLEO|nr:hypothetical protein EK21DRAFT_115687 [Setomelanomma holmii]